MTTSTPTVWFHEVQRPRWTVLMWIGVALCGLTAASPFLLFPDRTLPFHYFYVLVFAAGVLSLGSRMRTVGEGDRLEIERRWGGGLTIALRRVRSVRVSTCYPRIDGGWGVRNGQGVILTLDDGDVLYVGSAHAEALSEAIRARLSPSVAEPRPRTSARVRIPGGAARNAFGAASDHGRR